MGNFVKKLFATLNHMLLDIMYIINVSFLQTLILKYSHIKGGGFTL